MTDHRAAYCPEMKALTPDLSSRGEYFCRACAAAVYIAEPQAAALRTRLFSRRPLVHDLVVVGAIDNQEANQAAFETGQGMIHDSELSSPVDLEIDNGRAARRNGNGLRARQRRRTQAGALVDMVEDFANHVK